MSTLYVSIEDDPAHPEGGHALVRFPGLAGPAGPGRLLIEPEGFAYEGPRHIDVEGVASPEGLVFAVGGGKLDQLSVGVTVILSLQGTGLSAEVLWPALTPLRLAARRTIRPSQRRTVVDEAASPPTRAAPAAAGGAGVAVAEQVQAPVWPARQPVEPQPAREPIVVPPAAPLRSVPEAPPAPESRPVRPREAAPSRLPELRPLPEPVHALPAAAGPAAAPRHGFGLPALLVAAVLAFGAGAATSGVFALMHGAPVKPAPVGPPPPQDAAKPAARALYDSLFVESDVSPDGVGIAAVEPSDLVGKAKTALRNAAGQAKGEREAVFWLKRVLADAPDFGGTDRPWALTRLGNLLHRADDAPSQATARALLEVAAGMSYAEAAFDLGVLAEKGDAVAGPDLKQAKLLLESAKAGGYGKAGDELNRLKGAAP